MQRALLTLALILTSCGFGWGAQNRPAAPAPGANPGGAALEKILSRMDATAAEFRTTEADFLWDQYTKVVDEHDTQKGTVYFRRAGKDIEMLADIRQHNGVAEQKYVLFSNGKVQVYQPTIEQVTEYNAGKNRAEFESFLVLGFGGRGHDLLKSFDVHYAGTANIDGLETVKLELVPKAERVRNLFNRILLWIDPARGISVQQQFFDDRSGDYRLAKYSNIRINAKIPDSVFRLETTRKTKVVSPQG